MTHDQLEKRLNELYNTRITLIDAKGEPYLGDPSEQVIAAIINAEIIVAELKKHRKILEYS